MKHQFLIDADGTLKTYVEEHNQRVVPSAATITLYKPSTSTVIVEDIAMTIALDGLLSYVVDSANNDVVDENYKAVINYTYAGEDKQAILFYDVIRSILFITIDDADVVNELPTIAEKGFKTHGTADSGSNTTIVDAELTRFDDDYFTGGVAHSITQNEKRKITDFVQSTGTITTEAFSNAVTTDKYVLARSYTNEIERSFEKIEDLLKRAGKRPHLIMDSHDLRELHIQSAVAEVCKSFASEKNTGWWDLMEKYEARAYAIFKSITLKYDDNEDGVIDPSEENKRNTRFLGRN